MAIIMRHQELNTLSMTKRRMLVFVCGLALMLTTLPFTLKFHPLPQHHTHTRQIVQTVDLALDPACNPFGSLLACVQFTESSVETVR